MDNRRMEITEIILTSALVNGIFVLIIHSWIKNTFAKELETHKAQLRAETAERNIKLKQVFEPQARVIAETYAKLLKLFQNSKELAFSIQGGNADKIKPDFEKFNESKKDFAEFFFPNAIYIHESTADKIRQFLYKLDGMFILNQQKTSLIFQVANNPQLKKQLAEVGIQTESLEKNTSEILHLIYTEFQEALRVIP